MNFNDPESSLRETIQNTEADIEKAEDLLTQSKDLVSHIETNLKEVNNTRTNVRQYLEELDILHCSHQYMRVIQYIEHLRLVVTFLK